MSDLRKKKNSKGNNISILFKSKNIKETDCEKEVISRELAMCYTRTFQSCFLKLEICLSLILPLPNDGSSSPKQVCIHFVFNLYITITAFTFPSTTQPFPQKKSLNCPYS